MDHELSDAEALARTGREPEAFAVVYRRHVDAVLAFSLSRLGDRQLAADVTAETFAQALLSAGRFRPEVSPDRASALPWLLGIARRLIGRLARRGRVDRAARRRLGVQPLAVVDEDLARVERLVDLGAVRPALLAALEALTPPVRDAVALRVVEQRSYADIGRLLGCSAGAARVRVSRGLAQLARELQANTAMTARPATATEAT